MGERERERERDKFKDSGLCSSEQPKSCRNRQGERSLAQSLFFSSLGGDHQQIMSPIINWRLKYPMLTLFIDDLNFLTFSVTLQRMPWKILAFNFASLHPFKQRWYRAEP